MNLKVSSYNDSHKEQVMKLICDEYGYKYSEYHQFFTKFHEAPFQKNAIKTVVYDADNNDYVAGFFALFYWPYTYNNTTLNAYKGVNAIVNPDYRGQGVFKMILDFVDLQIKDKPIDFLIATPLPAAFKGFKKQGWTPLVDLSWNVKSNNIFSFLFPLKESVLKTTFPEQKLANHVNISDIIYQSDFTDFTDWRAHYYKTKKYYLSYQEGEYRIQFGIKINIRKKIIKELIIGEISTNHYNSTFIHNGLQYLLKRIKKIYSITFVSIAINPENEEIVTAINKAKFKPISNKIHIIIKPLVKNDNLLNNKIWNLYRADLDSW